MKKKLLITVIMILYLYGCQERKNNGVFYCQVENKIEEYPDSSFFSNITCINYYDGKLYVLDNKRGDIVELNDDLNKMKYVSRHGEAPYETVMPFAFSLLNDTVYVVDFGTRSMKKFYNGQFMGGFTLSNANENRFCLNDSMLFLSATTDTTSFLKITLRHPSEQVQLGKVVKEKTKTRTIMLNKRHLLYNKDGYIYSISGNYPYIEQYNHNGEYIKTFDISSIPIIKKSMEYAESLPYQDNSFYSYIMDAYLINDIIYLLCSSRTTQGEYRVNTILKLSISDNMKNVCTYILPHDYYSAFCASDSCLFVAQTTRNCVIEKLRIDDDKK